MDWRILTAITVVSWGAYGVLLKKASGLVAWQASMFLFVVGYAVFVGGYYLLEPAGTGATLMQKRSLWPLLAGMLCGLGAVTYFRALAVAPGSVFLPLVSLSLIFSGIGCIIFLKEPVSIRVVAGTVFAAAAVVLLAR